MADQTWARMWELGGRWYAQVLGAPVYVEVTGTTKRTCLDELRSAVGGEEVLTVEVVPPIAGVAEAAEIMGWDKRRVVTYIDRGSFPEPIATLASGRIWLREDVEDYARAWHERRSPSSTGAGG